MRACRICGNESTTWVLLAIMWPTGARKGETLGIALCDEHIDGFREDLNRYKPETV